MYDILKVLLSAIIIVAVSELAKINAVVGGFVKSLPIISLMAIIWLYTQTHDNDKVITLSYSTLWFVIPTLPFFLILPYFLKRGMNFYMSLLIATIIMLVCYGIMLGLLKLCKVTL